MDQATTSTITLGAVERHQVISRQQWLALRRPDITASDIAALCGVGKRTALAVWYEKTNPTAKPVDETNLMQRGRWLEPAIFEAMAECYPQFKTFRAKIYLRSPSQKLGCTPDALGELTGAFQDQHTGWRYEAGSYVIQGKVVSRPVFNKEWRRAEDEDDDHGAIRAPLGYQMQVLTETMLAEAAIGRPMHALLAALVIDTFGAWFYLIPVPRHPEAEQQILRMNANFRRDIELGYMPDIDFEKDGETLAELFPEDKGTTMDLTGDNQLLELLDERKALGEQTKANDARREAIKNIFRAIMTDHTYANLPGGRRVSLKLQADSHVPAHTKAGGRVLRELKPEAEKKRRR